MQAIGFLHIFQFSFHPPDWLVYRKWKMGDKEFNIRGFGRTKEEAILDYEQELNEMTKKNKHKNYPNSKYDLFMNDKMKKWLDTTNSFSFGHRKAKFDIGWYTGDTFKLFQLTFGDVLWDGELGFLVVFDIHIAFGSFSFTIYPFD